MYCIMTRNVRASLLQMGRRIHSNNSIKEAQKTLRDLILNRKSVKSFKSDPVPDTILSSLLTMTQRAPSGFNMQPYACVIVREQHDREKLADAMLASNARKVREAPIVAVFAADLEPSRRIPHIQQLMHTNGSSVADINNLPLYLRLFCSEGAVADNVRSLISTVMSPLRPVPSPVPAIAWSYKQTTFAAATLLHAAAAHGLSTCPMEGFDDVRVRMALNIPDRYSIPVVIALGYSQDTSTKKTARLNPTEVFFDGKFGQSNDQWFQTKP